MQEVPVNIWAVVAAGIASMAIGYAWYAPFLFGKQWQKLMGITVKDMEKGKQEMPRLMIIAFIATLVSAYVLRHVTVFSEAFYGMDWVTTGVMSGFWMWLGFIAPVQLTDWIYGGKKFQLFMINTGYQLASMLVMGAIVGGWS
ncbi:DUF1761 domain-containing protein [Candidatus Roizmanbacteria bacterium]|nr:DUF1761 domain-containing protein [Candidatus Roizmanbacteria bacterium]